MTAMFIMCVSYSGITQDFFSTTFTADDYIDNAGIVKFNGQPVMVANETCNGFVETTCTYLLGIDEDGRSITYLSDLGELKVFDKSIVANSEQLTVAGFDEDNKIKIIQLDTELNIINEASYKEGESLSFWIYSMTEFSGYYVISVFEHENEYTSRSTMYWFDVEDLSFQGSYTTDETSTSFRELSVDEDNKLKVVHQRGFGQKDVLTFNSEMELIDTWEIPEKGAIGYLNFEVLSNDDLLLGLQDYKYLIRYGSDGTQKWKIDVAEAFSAKEIKFLREAKEVSNGDILLCGSIKNFMGDFFGFIYLVQSNGEERFKRLYTTEEAITNFPLYGFVEVEDEGFLFFGSVREEPFPSQSTFHDTYWVLKTDYNGCIEDGCGEQIITSVNQPGINDIILSPNPVESVVEISGIDNFVSPQFEVVDFQGRVIMDGRINKDRTIDLSMLSSGIYLMHVIEGRELITIQKFFKI